MKLKKIISGGQTGADRTSLECAREQGIPTGGTAPRGWKTEDGPDPSLKEFGLVESASSDYPTRTKQNVKDADCTVWFGKTNSGGYYCTLDATLDLDKPFKINPTPEEFRDLCDEFEILNCAGNRKSKNPGVVPQVKEVFSLLKT